MPRIFDCFTFFNEWDVLKMRVEELYPVVDYFLIVSGETNFRGVTNTEPNVYTTLKNMGLGWALNKIEAGRCELPKGTFWDKEIFQRNFIKLVLENNQNLDVELEDTIIISDVDEIPRRNVVKPVRDIMRLRLDKYSYSINMLTDEGNTVVRLLPFKDLTGTVEEMRRGDLGQVIDNAGWEFSSLADARGILHKIHSFAHSEFDDLVNEQILTERIKAGVDILGRDIKHEVVQIDDTWPEAVKNDRDYWRKYEWSA